MSNMTISGAVSGIDTATIINQLVALQTNQQTLLKKQQSTQQSAADALGKLATALSGVGTQAAALARTSTWAGSTATSTWRPRWSTSPRARSCRRPAPPCSRRPTRRRSRC